MSADRITPFAADWLTSQEARKRLRIASCELMHLRDAGQLRFKKQGNAFLYASKDVERQRPATSGKPSVSRHS